MVIFFVLLLALLTLAIDGISTKSILSKSSPFKQTSSNIHASLLASAAPVYPSLVSLSGGQTVDIPSDFSSIVAKSPQQSMWIRWLNALKRFIFGVDTSSSKYSRHKPSKKRKYSPTAQESQFPASTWKNSAKSKSTLPKDTFESKSTTNQGLLRIQRELQSFMQSPPSYCKVISPEQFPSATSGNAQKTLRRWVVQLTGPPDTIYAGETYNLSISFPANYPNVSPSVYFLSPVPRHKHVYTNGDICLNLLGKDWRPIITAETLAVSILSMLSSAKEKGIPQDNAMHAENSPGRTQEYLYHDDRC
jgi:ubiquitin-conjugating enzyme E2 W